MVVTRWFIELLLPAGGIQARAVSTDRTTEQLSAEIHASVANLLACKARTSSEASTPQRQSALYEWRLLLAHATNPAKALKMAADLNERFGAAPLPWSDEVRREFDAYLEAAMAS